MRHDTPRTAAYKRLHCDICGHQYRYDYEINRFRCALCGETVFLPKLKDTIITKGGG